MAAHDALLGRFGLPTRVPADIRTADVLAALRYDKKRLADGARMPLVAEVGRLWRVDDTYAIPVSDAVVAQAIEAAREDGATRAVSQ